LNALTPAAQNLAIALILAFSLAGFSCKKSEKPVVPAPQPQRKETHVSKKDELIPVLDSLERAYEEACKNMGVANWNSYSQDGPADLDSAKGEFSKIFLDSAMAKLIDVWRDKSGSLADKLLARRLELWHRCYIGGAIYADPKIAKLENELQERIVTFKLKHGRKNITRAIINNSLRTEKRQPERRKLWSIASQVSAVTADDLLKLVALRNAKAKKYNQPNYYSLSLSLHGIDEAWLIKTLNYLEEMTRQPFEDFIARSKKKFKLKQFGPWDFDFALARSASLPDKYFPSDSVFDVIHTFERGIGFKVDSLPIKEVVKDIPYNGLSLAVVIPTDTRFLLNPTKGKGFYGVAFHEYGHSLKAVHTKVDYPILKGYEWIPGAQCAAYEEGIADLHAEFTEDSTWLATYTRADEDEVERYVQGRRLPGLYRLRTMLKNFFIEYSMYNNPAQDMDSVEHEMFKKYLRVDLPANEPHQFAASMWYTSYPCYYQNYILAGMIATQLQEALTDQFGEKKLTDKNVSDWIIRQLYATGETDEWGERIRNATGKSLEPGAYLRKLGIETTHLMNK
jgi:hypothetical protein